MADGAAADGILLDIEAGMVDNTADVALSRVDVDATDCAANVVLLGIELGIADDRADDGALFYMEIGEDGGTADDARLGNAVLLLLGLADGAAADGILLDIEAGMVDNTADIALSRVDVDATDCAANCALLGIKLGIAYGIADDGALFDMEHGTADGTADGARLGNAVLLLLGLADGAALMAYCLTLKLVWLITLQ